MLVLALLVTECGITKSLNSTKLEGLSCLDFPGGPDSKTSSYNEGDVGSTPGSGRSSGEGNGNPLQYCCLENPMDGGAW